MPVGTVAPKAIGRALLLHEDTYAAVLLLLLVDTYPDTDENGQLVVLQWTPEAIKMQLEDDFGIKLPKDTLDRIMAAIVILTTNYFFKDVRRFIELCNILAGDGFQPDEFDPADASEIMWGVIEAMIIYPPNNDPEDTEFSPEIRAYIAEVLKVEGIALPPDVLRLGAAADATDHIRMNFSDDPEMFQGVWEVQRAKRDDLVTMAKAGLQELASQLRVLSLQTGSVDQVLKQIQKIAGTLPAAEVAP